MMESNTNDEEAPKDPGASKALTGLQDNDIFGKLDRFIGKKNILIWRKRNNVFECDCHAASYYMQHLKRQ